MKTKLISRIFRTIQAKENCLKSNNMEWYKKHDDYLDLLAENYLPSGSGIDSGCKIDKENSNEKKIVILVNFHNMDEFGGYCGWSLYKVICRPSFDGPDIKIQGKDKYFIKDYLYDLFGTVLTEDFQPIS